MLYQAYVPGASNSTAKKKIVYLTLVTESDAEIMSAQGLAALRRERMMRLCQEAQAQGALLGYEDLVQLLLSSLSTLKRDLRLLRNQGQSVPLYRKRQRSLLPRQIGIEKRAEAESTP